ncbi:hypothetical protein [Rhodoblastus sp.]|uniref:hypothetical protein n=1 Tax=Rhodoblastus sp. TaxID=1962975 RepID=UPI003F9C74F9
MNRAALRPALRWFRAFASNKVKTMSDQKPINWTNARTLIALAILVGTELVGASWAAGARPASSDWLQRT